MWGGGWVGELTLQSQHKFTPTKSSNSSNNDFKLNINELLTFQNVLILFLKIVRLKLWYFYSVLHIKNWVKIIFFVMKVLRCKFKRSARI